MANLLHSDLHLPRWKRALLWLTESPLGIAVWSIPLGVACMVPVIWLGIWWPTLVTVAGLSFALGWNSARRFGKRNGRIDPL